MTLTLPNERLTGSRTPKSIDNTHLTFEGNDQESEHGHW